MFKMSCFNPGILLPAFILSVCLTPIHAAESDALDFAAMDEIAKAGDGFLVWERNVNWNWQIWTRPLGSKGKEEILVPPENGQNYFCPKLSPDGSRLAYMIYPKDTDAYDAKAIGSIWLMDLATRKQTRLVEKAISYGEDRAVVWLDNTRLCFMHGDRDTDELDISTGKSKPLVTKTHGQFAFLVNPTNNFATSGVPEFAPFDAKTGIVDNQPGLGGCQPYFSQDGKWGFWMGGVGGPINRFFLPLRTISPIIEKHDARMPAGRAFLYFPMLSPDMQLFTFAASPDQLDHFKANYNLFVARIDPETLELIGKPVRYTSNAGTDRFPDVFAKPLPLGSYFTEQPAKVTLQVPGGKSAQWRVDGAKAAVGASLDFSSNTEGDHWIEADAGGKTLRGLVHVRRATPPAILSVKHLDDKTLSITFNKPVSLTAAKALAGETALKWRGQSADDYVAMLELPPSYVNLADIIISGVRDKMPVPNELPPTRANVAAHAWPPSPQHLVFAWENRQTKPVADRDTVTPEPNGKVFWSAAGGLDTRGGWYALPPGGDLMLHDGARTKAITLEAIITPRIQLRRDELRPLFSLEDKSGAVKLAITQKADGFYLYLATEQKGEDKSGEELLAPAVIGSAQHLVVTYDNGELAVYLNGVGVPLHSKLSGRMAFEKGPGLLRVGASSKYPGATWSGSVDHIACYSVAFSPTDALALYDYAAPMLAKRAKIKPLTIAASLVESTMRPTLEKIKPYREALVRQLYEVMPKDAESPVQDIPVGTRVLVDHWVWINGETAPSPPSATGKVVHLVVEPVTAHPEIKSLVIQDDLTPGLVADEFLDVTPQ